MNAQTDVYYVSFEYQQGCFIEHIHYLKPNEMSDKRLVTIKKASSLTGASLSFFKQLIREGKLTRYRINSAIYISMVEFETLASINQTKPQGARDIKEDQVIIKNDTFE